MVANNFQIKGLKTKTSTVNERKMLFSIRNILMNFSITCIFVIFKVSWVHLSVFQSFSVHKLKCERTLLSPHKWNFDAVHNFLWWSSKAYINFIAIHTNLWKLECEQMDKQTDSTMQSHKHFPNLLEDIIFNAFLLKNVNLFVCLSFKKNYRFDRPTSFWSLVSPPWK